jgi:drug/metabolite transporter (DMT)-like permease
MRKERNDGKTRARGARPQLAFVAVAVTVLLWASAFVVIRGAGQHFSAGSLALGRLVVAALALGITSVVRRQEWPARAAWPGIIVSGLLWFGVYSVALNWGEQKVDAGTASMLVNIGPILIALLSGWLLKDALPVRVFAGLAISFAGTAVVGFSVSGTGKASILGVLLCLVAAVSYAGGVVAQKPALRYASALQVTTFSCAIGAIACLPFVGQLITEVGKAPLTAGLDVVYLGVFPTAVAFTTWAYALSRTTTTKYGRHHLHRARGDGPAGMGLPRPGTAVAKFRRRRGLPRRRGRDQEQAHVAECWPRESRRESWWRLMPPER